MSGKISLKAGFKEIESIFALQAASVRKQKWQVGEKSKRKWDSFETSQLTDFKIVPMVVTRATRTGMVVSKPVGLHGWTIVFGACAGEWLGERGVSLAHLAPAFFVILYTTSTKPWNCFLNTTDSNAINILTKDKAMTRKLNDTVGVCLRCWLYGESCDGNNSCQGCQLNLQSWKYGCARIKLEEMWQKLQPKELGRHLQLAEMEALFNGDHYECISYSGQLPIMLKLSWGLGTPLEIMVKEVKPIGSFFLENNAIRIHWWTKDHAEIQPFQLNSPPLMPDFSSERQNWTNVQDQIKALLKELLCDKDASIIWHCFWAEEENTREDWHRDVFFAIWEYHQLGMKDHEMLTDALKLLILNHFLTTSLIVPAEHVDPLLRYLRHSEQYTKIDAPISPRTINRAVKMCAYPLLRHAAQETIKNLQALIHKNGCSVMCKDLVFCLAFICAAVVGKNQSAALDMARLQKDRNDDGLTTEQAKALALDMEANFTDKLIELCQCGFEMFEQTTKPGPQCQSQGEDRARNFQLMERIKKLTIQAADDPPAEIGMDNIHDQDFSVMNVRRVLAKFICQVFPEWGGQRETRQGLTRVHTHCADDYEEAAMTCCSICDIFKNTSDDISTADGRGSKLNVRTMWLDEGRRKLHNHFAGLEIMSDEEEQIIQGLIQRAGREGFHDLAMMLQSLLND